MKSSLDTYKLRSIQVLYNISEPYKLLLSFNCVTDTKTLLQLGPLTLYVTSTHYQLIFTIF